MIKRRRNTFETNSSSAHSITFTSREAKLDPSYLYVSDDGFIHTKLGKYGWGPETLDTQDEKLSYLVTMVTAMNGYHSNWCDTQEEIYECLENIRNCEEFKTISDAIADYTGCSGIILDDSTGYIDHQSIKNSNLCSYLSQWGVNSVEDFIFGNVVVNVDNDNH